MRRIMQLLGCSLLLTAQISLGDEPKQASAVATWSMEKGPRALDINFDDLLTIEQKEIIHSGFSTFTLLAISETKFNATDTPPQVRLACKVKYDTWEERYQMSRIEPAPVVELLTKNYQTWAKECLRYTLANNRILDKFAKGGALYAVLQIRQSSPDEGAKIKNWLVRQQSGFMQGLYAHMLGDFQFSGMTKITIQVPAYPVDDVKKSNLLKKMGK